MLGGRSRWVRHSIGLLKSEHCRRRFCNSTTQNNINNNKHSDSRSNSITNQNGKLSDFRDLEGYRDLDNLNFMKAAKILFSTPTKKKTFGLDFHLVQLFFALMPSLAVYLVAQYARYQMRKMEADLELKKKAEEEKKAKEMEAAAAEEKEAESANPELSKVKERLEALEETLKEIVVETKKRPSEEKSMGADQHKKEGPSSRSDDGHIAAKNLPTTHETTSGQPQKQHDSEKRGSGEDGKK